MGVGILPALLYILFSAAQWPDFSSLTYTNTRSNKRSAVAHAQLTDQQTVLVDANV